MPSKTQDCGRSVAEHLEQNPHDRILIFSEYRDTVEHLVADLNGIPDAVVDRFIGQSAW